MPVQRPCIDRIDGRRGCPEYAMPGESRCEQHLAEWEAQRRADPTLTGRRGTSSAHRKAKMEQLRAAHWKCEHCGKTKAEADRRGEHLELHHKDGDANNHAKPNRQILCTPCHRAVS